MSLAHPTPLATPSARKPRDDEIDFYGLTHQGKVRTSNNDHFLIASLAKRMEVRLTSLPGLAEQALGNERIAFIGMVADGVGGGDAGEEASRIALASVTEYLAMSLQAYYSAEERDGALREALQQAVLGCHERVLKRAAEHGDARRRATTLTLVIGVWPWTYIVQVGDSRHYIFRDGKLTQTTRDQTFAQDLLDRGALTAEQAAGSRLRNVLSSAIGGDQAAPVVTQVPSHWNNIHLGCSDGLTKHVSDDRIRERMASMTSAKQLCQDLVQDALDGGGTDNITVLAVRTVRNDKP